MLPLFRLGLGGRIGHGAQWMSWIHIDDLVALIQHAVRHDGLTGPINGVSPAPVTNREFAATLAATLRRPAPLPVPAAALGLALGEMSGILTASQRVVPRAALEKGFSFRHDRLAATLATILSAR